jgi:hypothetical protein
MEFTGFTALEKKAGFDHILPPLCNAFKFASIHKSCKQRIARLQEGRIDDFLAALNKTRNWYVMKKWPVGKLEELIVLVRERQRLLLRGFVERVAGDKVERETLNASWDVHNLKFLTCMSEFFTIEDGYTGCSPIVEKALAHFKEDLSLKAEVAAMAKAAKAANADAAKAKAAKAEAAKAEVAKAKAAKADAKAAKAESSADAATAKATETADANGGNGSSSASSSAKGKGGNGSSSASSSAKGKGGNGSSGGII